MPWGRLDDSLYDHPKLDKLGRHRLPCIGLNTLAQSWCNRWLTDGHIPSDRVPRLGGTAALADLLVVAGLWERTDDGYRIHDFLDYNDSRDTVLAQREAARERMRDNRQNRRRSSGDVQANVTGSSGDVQPPRPIPVPSRPDPVPAVDRPPVMTVIDYLEERTGRLYSFGNGSKVHEALTPDVRDFGADRVIQEMVRDTTEHPDIGQLVFNASRRLHPITSPEKPGEPDAEYVAQALADRRKARLTHA